MRKITKREATHTLRAVAKAFGYRPDDEYGPKIIEGFDWTGTGGCTAIVWEEGPYEWAITAAAAQYGEPVVNEELASLAEEFGVVPKIGPIKVPDGLFIEPITSWALGIYRI
jgi:hypothetical protein